MSHCVNQVSPISPQYHFASLPNRQDIRTLYVLFILSFVDRDTTSSVKTTFLQEHREVFVSIFKGLVQDPLPVVQRVLETCWEGLWADPKVSRSLKIAAFGEATISHVSGNCW